MYESKGESEGPSKYIALTILKEPFSFDQQKPLLKVSTNQSSTTRKLQDRTFLFIILFLSLFLPFLLYTLFYFLFSNYYENKSKASNLDLIDLLKLMKETFKNHQS